MPRTPKAGATRPNAPCQRREREAPHLVNQQARECDASSRPASQRRAGLVLDRTTAAEVSASQRALISAPTLYAISFSSSSPGNSLTDGYFMISFRAIFHAF